MPGHLEFGVVGCTHSDSVQVCVCIFSRFLHPRLHLAIFIVVGIEPLQKKVGVKIPNLHFGHFGTQGRVWFPTF